MHASCTILVVGRQLYLPYHSLLHFVHGFFLHAAVIERLLSEKKDGEKNTNIAKLFESQQNS